MQEFALMIQEKNKEVPAEEMQVCRILSIHKFNILDLCEMEVENVFNIVFRND